MNLCKRHHVPMIKSEGEPDYCDICYDQAKDARIAELEAENAELKEQLEGIYDCIRIGAIIPPENLEGLK